MLAEWGDLRPGIILPHDREVADGVVHGRGKLWYQHHVATLIPSSPATVRAIYWHPKVYRHISAG